MRIIGGGESISDRGNQLCPSRYYENYVIITVNKCVDEFLQISFEDPKSSTK